MRRDVERGLDAVAIKRSELAHDETHRSGLEAQVSNGLPEVVVREL